MGSTTLWAAVEPEEMEALDVCVTYLGTTRAAFIRAAVDRHMRAIAEDAGGWDELRDQAEQRRQAREDAGTDRITAAKELSGP